MRNNWWILEGVVIGLNTETIKLILSCLFGGTFIGFIQFLIQRKDGKDEWKEEIAEAIRQLEGKFTKQDLKMDAMKSEINACITKLHDENGQKIDSIRDEMDNGFERMRLEDLKQNAIQSRVRILRFGDEIRRGVLHSKESYDQTKMDIKTYLSYCSMDKDFENGIATANIKLIEDSYDKRMINNDFI